MFEYNHKLKKNWVTIEYIVVLFYIRVWFPDHYTLLDTLYIMITEKFILQITNILTIFQ